MKYILLIIGIIIFCYMAYKLSNYEDRMKLYNNHMCVEVYGLNEVCK